MIYLLAFLMALSFPPDIAESFHINSFAFNNRGKIVCASNAIKDGFLDSSLVPIQDGTESITAQIEDMRKEAITRLDNLSNKIDNDYLTKSEKQMEEAQEALESFQKGEDRHHPLEETSWKIILNLGRERGTWMPKDWGLSGDRLLVKLSVEFTCDDLKDKEEFIDGVEGSKILKVLDNEVTIGPTIETGIKGITAKSGGWNIFPGEGPAGTDLMRFYIEIEERAQHLGSDIFCPKGRVYCTCGYFPDIGGRRSSGKKEMIREEQKFISSRYEFLMNEENNDTSMFSLKKISRSREIRNLVVDSKKLNEHLHIARIQEPERELLRFSNDGKTALTREGGICMKVKKGLSTEYHILGRFSIGSLKKSKVSNNSKKLRP